jgi:hypothetical protein
MDIYEVEAQEFLKQTGVTLRVNHHLTKLGGLAVATANARIDYTK